VCTVFAAVQLQPECFTRHCQRIQWFAEFQVDPHVQRVINRVLQWTGPHQRRCQDGRICGYVNEPKYGNSGLRDGSVALAVTVAAGTVDGASAESANSVMLVPGVTPLPVGR
jgi:hypothetical protein